MLRSLIESRLVPVVDLREVFRQSAQSQIVVSAHALLAGSPPALRPLPAALLHSDPAGALSNLDCACKCCLQSSRVQQQPCGGCQSPCMKPVLLMSMCMRCPCAS